MRIISHRSNIVGPEPEKENNPAYVERALELGFEVEVDVWYEREAFALGHNEPRHLVGLDFLDNPRFWLHCKNIAALSRLIHKVRANCFFHQNDDVTLTSGGFLWTYPGKLLYRNSIAVIQGDVGNDADWPGDGWLTEARTLPYAVCTDYPLKVKEFYESGC